MVLFYCNSEELINVDGSKYQINEKILKMVEGKLISIFEIVSNEKDYNKIYNSLKKNINTLRCPVQESNNDLTYEINYYNNLIKKELKNNILEMYKKYNKTDDYLEFTYSMNIEEFNSNDFINYDNKFTITICGAEYFKNSFIIYFRTDKRYNHTMRDRRETLTNYLFPRHYLSFKCYGKLENIIWNYDIINNDDTLKFYDENNICFYKCSNHNLSIISKKYDVYEICKEDNNMSFIRIQYYDNNRISSDIEIDKSDLELICVTKSEIEKCMTNYDLV